MRPSKRDLERAIADLDTDDSAPDASIDAREGVSAPWITYNEGGFDDDLPDDPRAEVLVLTEQGFVPREEHG